MKLTVKDMDISSGGSLIAILHREDAERLDLHTLDRILISNGDHKITVIIDITDSRRMVPPGSIGLFEEVIKKAHFHEGTKVGISLSLKPKAISYIKKKLDGNVLSKKEINEIIDGVVKNELSDVELTYFVSACYMKGLSTNETINLTRAIINHGGRLKLKKRVIIDKHCSGGVCGNRTTMVVVPILAAAGLCVPKTSSRSISSPAGTADTMEVLANVSFPLRRMKSIVDRVGACIAWGGSMDLAAADDRLIHVRHPLSLDPKGMLLASIIAKKASVNATHVLIDVPIGPETKIKNRKEAMNLKRGFLTIGRRLGIHIKVIITNGSQPIGNGVGPALEARDVLYVLRGDYRMPQDLKRKSVRMAATLLEMAHNVPKGKGMQKALDILESGAAYKKMVQIIRAQGGRVVQPEQIPLGRLTFDVKATHDGMMTHLDNAYFSRLARVAGAPSDKGAGVYLYKHVKDPVKRGDKLYTIFAQSREKMKYAIEIVNEGQCCMAY